MEYTRLSAEAQRNLLEGRLEQLESQHFNNEVNISAATAILAAMGIDPNPTKAVPARMPPAAGKTKAELMSFTTTKVQLEAEIGVIRTQIQSLPAVETEEAN